MEARKKLFFHFKNVSRVLRYNLAVIFPGVFKKYDFKAIQSMDSSQPDIKAFAEPELFFISSLLPEHSTLVDIGSNLGIYLFRFENAKKFDRVIGIEPIPILFKRLRRYFPNLEIYDYAISDKTQNQIFKIPYIEGKVFDTRGTLHNFTEENETGNKRIKVKTITLDDFVVLYHIDNLSFIKIDIEGHEINALKGARETLKRFKPLLMMEIEQRHHPDTNLQDIFTEIIAFGYSGYFFDKAQIKFREISEFNAKDHQRDQNLNENYINNFLFIDNQKSNLIRQFPDIEMRYKTIPFKKTIQ